MQCTIMNLNESAAHECTERFIKDDEYKMAINMSFASALRAVDATALAMKKVELRQNTVQLAG